MQGVGNEFYERPAEAEVEKSQVLGYRPGESQQSEARRSEVQGRDRHDEEREREGDSESQEIEERVVGDARAAPGGWSHRYGRSRRSHSVGLENFMIGVNRSAPMSARTKSG